MDTVKRQRLRILLGTLASGLESRRGHAALELIATGRELAESLENWAAFMARLKRVWRAAGRWQPI